MGSSNLSHAGGTEHTESLCWVNISSYNYSGVGLSVGTWGPGGASDVVEETRTYLCVQLPVEVDLIRQPFQAGLQLYLVHVSFIHILGGVVGEGD